MKKATWVENRGLWGKKEGEQAEMKISGDTHTRRRVQERGQCLFKMTSKWLINTVRHSLGAKLAGHLICISKHTMRQPPAADQALLHRPQAEPRALLTLTAVLLPASQAAASPLSA